MNEEYILWQGGYELTPLSRFWCLFERTCPAGGLSYKVNANQRPVITDFSGLQESNKYSLIGG
jgi:hypothetical protein